MTTPRFIALMRHVSLGLCYQASLKMGNRIGRRLRRLFRRTLERPRAHDVTLIKNTLNCAAKAANSGQSSPAAKIKMQ